MTAALLVGVLLLVIGIANWTLRRWRPEDADELISVIDQMLPQTQCAQCGFAGCLPYATALARHATATNLCAPGGAPLLAQLNELLGVDETAVPPLSHTGIANIREAQCIGCALCLAPCPVDAIVGANGYMHTVVRELCTGCELCVPACPVDCIDMQDLLLNLPLNLPLNEDQRTPEITAKTDSTACIRCGACSDVCPVSLPAQSLLELVNLKQWSAAEDLQMQRCIECGLCDEVCPSQIPLEHQFAQAKKVIAAQAQQKQQRQALKSRFVTHQKRLETSAQARLSKRQARLKKPRAWQP